MYRSDEAADQAEVRRQALMIDGSALMPAFWMAMTKGAETAVPVPRARRGSFEGTSRPVMRVP